MNMNNFPRGFEHATESKPLPRWVMWLAAALIFGGYALLEWQDAQVEQAIQAVAATCTGYSSGATSSNGCALASRATNSIGCLIGGWRE